MTSEELRRVAHEVADVIVDYLGALAGGPVCRAYPPDLGAWLRSEPVPRQGAGVDSVLADFRRVVEPFPFGNGHPRYAAWVNSPPHPVGILAEALAATMNPSVAGGDHAAVHVERQVVRWVAGLAGLGSRSGGLLVSGGSAATLTAFAVARQRAVPEVRRVGLPGAYAVYLSGEGHGSARKAVEILGLGSDSIRTIEVDSRWRMRPSALRARIEADLAAGVTPIAVMASAGTVNTGAIDPLASIADICTELGVWLHVDAAYGGPALLLHPTYESEKPGLARADSISIDPHKWLYAPVDAGLLLLRDAGLAREAFSLVPPYLQAAGEPWLSEYGIEQTRPFRALKVWMLLKHLGTDGYRDLIDHDLAVAAHLAATVEAAPTLELLAHGLSVVCFRVRAGDEHNRRVLAEVQNGGRAFLAGTTVDGVFALRACVVNPGMTREDAEAIVAEVIKGSLRAFPD